MEQKRETIKRCLDGQMISVIMFKIISQYFSKIPMTILKCWLFQILIDLILVTICDPASVIQSTKIQHSAGGMGGPRFLRVWNPHIFVTQGFIVTLGHLLKIPPFVRPNIAQQGPPNISFDWNHVSQELGAHAKFRNPTPTPSGILVYTYSPYY